MKERLNVVTKIIGTVMLGLLICLLINWLGNEKATSMVYLFTFLFAVDVVLFFEKMTACDALYIDSLEENNEESILTIYFLIPIILSLVLLGFLVIGTFTKMRGYYWLITLLEFCGISLLYSNRIWNSILEEKCEDELSKTEEVLEENTSKVE